jgi:hypothetical protein
MAWGMPPGFAAALAEKYAIMRIQAEAQKRSADAGATLDVARADALPIQTRAQAGALDAAAGLDNVRAKLLPDQTAADIAVARANARNIEETTRYVGPLARANVGLLGSQGMNFRASARNTDAESDGIEQLNKRFGFRFGL